MNFSSKYFGQNYSMILFISLVILTFTLKVNLICFQEFGSFPFSIYLFVLISFFLFIKLKSWKSSKIPAISFLFFALISQTYLMSFFQWYAENNPVENQSYSDQSAGEAMVWILFIPVTFLIQLLLGFVFDKLRRSEKKFVTQK